jgi:hypothetical protein
VEQRSRLSAAPPPSPTPQDGGVGANLVDDHAIPAAERLLRICKTPMQVSLDRRTNTYVLSDQIFAALGPGCSVELCSHYEAAGETLATRVAEAGGAFAAVTVTAEKVRATAVSGDPKNATELLKVAFTPIRPGGQYAPNPYHGDIFPPTKGSSNKALTRASSTVVPVDQVAAAAAYAKRVGNPG